MSDLPELPPLPEYSMSRHPMSIRYDADQMQAYAREAVRAAVERERANAQSPYGMWDDISEHKRPEVPEIGMWEQAKAGPVARVHRRQPDEPAYIEWLRPPGPDGTLIYAHPPTQAEPVTQVELIEESANEFPIELRQQVRDAMNNAWVGGYNECVDHPPTSEWNEEEFAELLGKIEDWGNSRTGTPADELTRRYEVMWEAIRALKPATSEWNDAIEAAANLISPKGVIYTAEMAGIVGAFAQKIRALKREPR